jgi:hypothetical protein
VNRTPRPITAAQRERVRQLAEHVRSLQDEPEGSAARLAQILERLERRGHPLTIATGNTLPTVVDQLRRADTHGLLLTRTTELPVIYRRAALTRLGGDKPRLPDDLQALARRATTSRYRHTRDNGWALELHTDGIGILINRGDPNRARSRSAAEAAAAGRLTGRPPAIPADIRRQIHAAHQAGHTPGHIATALTQAGIPTVNGRPWHRNTIRRVLRNPPPNPREKSGSIGGENGRSRVRDTVDLDDAQADSGAGRERSDVDLLMRR